MKILKKSVAIDSTGFRNRITVGAYCFFLMILLGNGVQSLIAKPKSNTLSNAGSTKENTSKCEALLPSPLYARTGHLSYLERRPVPDIPTSPLVIALHGLGHHKEGFSRLTKRLPASWRVITIDAPFKYGRGWAWYRFKCVEAATDLSLSLEALLKTLVEIKRRYPKSPKPALFGFSQGGVITLSAVAHQPLLWSSVASLSGYWLSNEALINSSLSQAPEILMTHGDIDRVVPASKGQRAARVLGDAGGLVAWFSFNGGHTVPMEVTDILIDHFKTAWRNIDLMSD